MLANITVVTYARTYFQLCQLKQMLIRQLLSEGTQCRIGGLKQESSSPVNKVLPFRYVVHFKLNIAN